MRKHQVQALLMGGQACILYGAAEFSRDTDLAILADAANLKRLGGALGDLEARPIAVPPFELDYLRRGHAIHFRCQHQQALRLRVDVMSTMRGVAPFPELWERRTTFDPGDGEAVEVLSLADLVQSKKTQRDKDWPMLRRLVEAHYFEHRHDPTAARLVFWLRELRTASLLLQLWARCSNETAEVAATRPLLQTLTGGAGPLEVEQALQLEEQHERQLDRVYWQPLKQELETLRHALRASGLPVLS